MGTADRAISARHRIYPGWSAVGLAFLIQFVASGPIYYGFGVFAETFEREFHASRASINLILTLITVFSGFAGIPIGWLLRRFSVRTVLLVGAIGQITGLVIVAQASSFREVVFGYGVVVGLADALLGVQLTNMLVVRWFERRRGLALGISVTAASFASIILPPLLTLLIVVLGWRTSFLMLGAALAALVPLMIWKAGLPATIPEAERLAPQTVQIDVQDGEMLGSALRSRDFWIVTLTVGAMFAANMAIISALIPYARAQGLSPYAAAGLLSLQGMVALAGKIGFGMIGDRTSLSRGLATAAGCGALSMVLWLTGGHVAILALAAVTFGLCMGGALPMFGVVLARRFGLRDYPMIVGASRTAMAPLMFAMPLVSGYLFDLSGSWRPTFAVLLGMLLLSAVLCLTTRFVLLPASQRV